MIELSISREAAGLLGANMESHFSIDALESGLALCQAGKVTHIWKDQFNIIHAIVGGKAAGHDYKLQIDLDFFLASECKCGERFCPHMAAVFFVLYREHAEPEQWLKDILSSLPDPLENESPQAEKTKTFSPEQPDHWEAMLDRELDSLYRRQTERFRIDVFYYTAYKKLSAFAEVLDEGRRPYFRLFCAMKIMLHAEEHLTTHSEDYPHPYAQRVAADLSDFFTDKLRDAAGQADGSANTDSAGTCRALIRDLLTRSMPLEGQSAFQWIEVHRFLWTHLLINDDWREQENKRLMAISDSGSTETSGKIALMAAHLDWLLGRDEAAMAKLAHPMLPVAGWVVAYLDTHAKTASWARLGRWLEFLLPHLRRASTEAFNKALSHWREYARRTHDDSSLCRALAALLPRSYAQYSEYLIKTARYEQWVYFHLLNGISPAKIERTQLKEVEQKRPVLALPIYHHAIERLLASRNRTAYRETVKLLKRMKEVYAASEENLRFREFIERLAGKYQRLHAFMEELEKGKLLG